MLAQSYMRSGRYDDARNVAQRIQKEFPDSPVGLVLEGGIGLAQKDLTAAKTSFEKASLAFPGDPSAADAMAKIAALGGDTAEMRRLYESVLHANPKHIRTIVALGDLDLVEIEALVDGDHQPEILERKADDFRRRYLQDLRELADRDELVDTDELLLALDFSNAHRLGFFAYAATIDAATARGRTTHRGHGLGNVRIHDFLIHRPALALFPAGTRGGASGADAGGRRITGRRSSPDWRTTIVAACGPTKAAWRCRRDWAWRKGRATRNRARTRSARGDRTRAWTIASSGGRRQGKRRAGTSDLRAWRFGGRRARRR